MPEKACTTKECYLRCRALQSEAARAAADCAFVELGLSGEICSPDREVAEIWGAVRRAKRNAAEAYREYLKSHC